MPTTEKLALWKINQDLALQGRDAIDYETVRGYAEAMAAGAVFPEVRVYFDGAEYWLSRGFHRVLACEFAGLGSVAAEVRPGTRLDAAWDAAAANQGGDRAGLRRTEEDERRALAMALRARPGLGDREIAEHIGVDPSAVAAARGGDPRLTADRRVGINSRIYRIRDGRRGLAGTER